MRTSQQINLHQIDSALPEMLPALDILLAMTGLISGA